MLLPPNYQRGYCDITVHEEMHRTVLSTEKVDVCTDEFCNSNNYYYACNIILCHKVKLKGSQYCLIKNGQKIIPHNTCYFHVQYTNSAI